jgi:hypothetical protein
MVFSRLALAPLAAIALISCGLPVAIPPAPMPEKIDGITVEAPSRTVDGAWTEPIAALGADWVAIIPYASSRQGEPELRWGGGQWWGETPEGAAAMIRQAHARGLKVLLKPQVWVRGGWAGSLDFDDETLWMLWEADYDAYLMRFVDLAAAEKVEMLCLGTELRHSYIERPEYWRALIAAARETYSGPLTVAANWDDYMLVPFWDRLDQIGVDAYFPLSRETHPTTATLVAAWQPIRATLKAFSEKHGRPILFTEYGYRSVDQATWNPWEKENTREWPANAEAQATAFAALLEVFWAEPWFAGGFVWEWRVQTGRRPDDKDFTPQGKPAADVLARYYGPPLPLPESVRN